MATKQQNDIENQDPEVVIETAINETEEFLFKNGKKLLTALAVIVVIAGAIFGYKYLYQAPRAEKASDLMYVAEQLFAAQNYQQALDGDGNNAGFLEVIETYGSTAVANVANHYAGICYLNLGDEDKALAYLQDYKTTDGAPNQIINAQNFGLQADIMSQKQDYKTAASLYSKAIDASNNALTAPIYLQKIALVYEQLGQNESALQAAQRILDEYPTSLEARDIEKFIGQLEQK